MSWGAIPKFAILSGMYNRFSSARSLVKPPTVMAVEDIANIPPSVPNDPDPFLIGFITTAWRRTATRCEISKNGPLMLSYFGGHAVGQLVRRIRLPDAYLDGKVLSELIIFHGEDTNHLLSCGNVHRYRLVF